MGFGRKVFGRKGMAPQQSETRQSGRIFDRGRSNDGSSASGSPFDRFYAALERSGDHKKQDGYMAFHSTSAMELLSPEERGHLLADLVQQPGVHDSGSMDKSPREKAAQNALWSIWNHEIEVAKEHLSALLDHLINHPDFRTQDYYEERFRKLMRLIDSAIKQGAYLSSSNCEALAEMGQDIRSKPSRRDKARYKKLIARAEKIEKLAGVEVSATEFLLQRCEGADNEFAIADKARPNAQFWADLLAEVCASLNEIRLATKGSKKPKWAQSAEAFEAAWPACGEIAPSFEAWKGSDQPVKLLKEHNGRRNGWADAEAYRGLPSTIPGAVAHSRFDWASEHIPGLDVLGDLENSDWTALVEHLITQRRATKATKKWQKEALALCEPLGLETVQTQLHNWLALFHSPALGRQTYTSVSNGERFVAAIDRLEQAHAEWPDSYAQQTEEIGRAIAMCVASGADQDLCQDFHPQLIRLDDRTYKNKSATDGVLHLPKPSYRHADGQRTYSTLSNWMRLSVENEEFLRGALWLAALLPDRARAIENLELTAQSAATYLWTGDDAMRSKIIANAAIATLIAMGGNDIDAAVLRLSKTVEHRTIKAPLLAHLNLGE